MLGERYDKKIILFIVKLFILARNIFLLNILGKRKSLAIVCNFFYVENAISTEDNKI